MCQSPRLNARQQGVLEWKSRSKAPCVICPTVFSFSHCRMHPPSYLERVGHLQLGDKPFSMTSESRTFMGELLACCSFLMTAILLVLCLLFAARAPRTHIFTLSKPQSRMVLTEYLVPKISEHSIYFNIFCVQTFWGYLCRDWSTMRFKIVPLVPSLSDF